MNKPASPDTSGRQGGASGFSWWPYAVLGAVLVAIVAFVIVTRNGSMSPSAPGLTGQSAAERGLAVGAPAPVMSLQSTDGIAISLDQLKGSKVVVYFYEGGG